jgi:hypothetical protein
MKLAGLSPELLDEIRASQYDQIVEKHEGPWTWSWSLNYCEFMKVSGRDVLLPIERERHANVTILRCIVSDDGQSLTVFLKDTTYDQGIFAGFVAVCDRFRNQDFYVAILYHEWYVVENKWQPEGNSTLTF